MIRRSSGALITPLARASAHTPSRVHHTRTGVWVRQGIFFLIRSRFQRRMHIEDTRRSDIGRTSDQSLARITITAITWAKVPPSGKFGSHERVPATIFYQIRPAPRLCFRAPPRPLGLRFRSSHPSHSPPYLLSQCTSLQRLLSSSAHPTLASPESATCAVFIRLTPLSTLAQVTELFISSWKNFPKIGELSSLKETRTYRPLLSSAHYIFT